MQTFPMRSEYDCYRQRDLRQRVKPRKPRQTRRARRAWSRSKD